MHNVDVLFGDNVAIASSSCDPAGSPELSLPSSDANGEPINTNTTPHTATWWRPSNIQYSIAGVSLQSQLLKRFSRMQAYALCTIALPTITCSIEVASTTHAGALIGVLIGVAALITSVVWYINRLSMDNGSGRLTYYASDNDDDGNDANIAERGDGGDGGGGGGGGSGGAVDRGVDAGLTASAAISLRARLTNGYSRMPTDSNLNNSTSVV